MFKKPQQTKEEMAKVFEEATNQPDRAKPQTQEELPACIQLMEFIANALLAHKKAALEWRLQSTILHAFECGVLLFILYKLGGK